MLKDADKMPAEWRQVQVTMLWALGINRYAQVVGPHKKLLLGLERSGAGMSAVGIVKRMAADLDLGAAMGILACVCAIVDLADE